MHNKPCNALAICPIFCNGWPPTPKPTPTDSRPDGSIRGIDCGLTSFQRSRRTDMARPNRRWPWKSAVNIASRNSYYEGWSISNEKIRDANDDGQIHFTVFQYNPLQAQRAFPIDVLASLHRPRRTVCLAVWTSHLSRRWPLHHSQTSVHKANLSKIGTRGSQTEPGLVNTAVDWAIRSRILELQPLPWQRCGQVHRLDEAAHRDSTFCSVSPW